MIEDKYNNSFKNISLFLFSIILGVTICEIGARFIGLGDPILYDADPLIGYRLKPNQRKKRLKNSYITTNNEGFRVSYQEDNKNLSKLVFIGDSVTYGGSYIDDSDLFSSLFCKISDEDDYCLNGAINSWGLHNMGRFISNFQIYSELKPKKFILIILPGDEHRNLRSLTDTPYWQNRPRNPRAINEILKFFLSKQIIPKLESNERENTEVFNKKLNEITKLQKAIAWKELEIQLINSKHPIDLVITPPRRWFKAKKKFRKEIKLYDKFLENISSLKNINKTCNLYYKIENYYKPDLYVDGVHLSKKGHMLWAKNILGCLQ